MAIPVSAEIRDLARDHGAQAIERLVALMDSKSVAVRVEYLPPKLSVKSGESLVATDIMASGKSHG